MRWQIESSKSFEKKIAKLLKKNPQLSDIFWEVIGQLTENPFEPSLQTHILSGALKGKYACTLTHKLRIVFEITDNTILLLNIGSHDEVY